MRGSGPSKDVEKGEAVRLSSVAGGGTPLHDDLQQAPNKIPGIGTSAGKVAASIITTFVLCEIKPHSASCSKFFFVLNLS